jgi:phage regulator Rha-like protein
MTNELSIKTVTMTSKEVANLTGKQHSNVLRDIRNMIAALSASAELCWHLLLTANSGTYSRD